MHVLTPAGAVNEIVLASTWVAVMISVVAGSHVGPLAQRTAVFSRVSRSFTVYSTPGSAIHLIAHPTVPFEFDQPNLMLDGSAYS